MNLTNSAPQSAAFFLATILMLTTLQISGQDRDETAVRDKALKILRHELNSDSFWVKVHAAEFLISLGQAKEAETVFLKELEMKGNIPIQRIGI